MKGRYYMINGNNMYIQTAGMNIRKDNDDWRRAVDTVDAAEIAILTEKTITENGTYNPSDDSADGYSKITVDVSGGDFMYVAFPVNGNGSYSAQEAKYGLLCNSADGSYNLPSGSDLPFKSTAYNAYLLTPANAVIPLSIEYGEVVFTPGENCSFVDRSGNPLPITGDTITPLDGKVYHLTISRNLSTGQLSRVITKTSANFSAEIIKEDITG
jgi:hypothetical protein